MKDFWKKQLEKNWESYQHLLSLAKTDSEKENARKLFDVIESLTSEMPLQAKNKDHNLTGNYSEFRECHILPDWLLIYRINESNKTLELVRTGSHSDLF